MKLIFLQIRILLNNYGRLHRETKTLSDLTYKGDLSYL